MINLFLVASATGIIILFDRGSQINPRKVGNIEGLLLHRLLDIGLFEDGPANRGAVPALVPGEVLDVVDSLRVGGWDTGLLIRRRRTEHPVLQDAGQRRFVFGIGTRPGYLPGFLEETF